MTKKRKKSAEGEQLKPFVSPQWLATFNQERKPYRCPVCGGRGTVPHGYYSTQNPGWNTADITPETCRACGGTGIVWG